MNKNGLAEAKFDRHSQYFSRESLETTGIAASSTVQVALTRNKNVFKQAQVLFLAPVKLTIVDYNFETALHDYVNVYISLYGLHNGAYQAFTSCDGPQFDAELTQRIFEVVSHKQIPNVKDSCKLIRLKGVTVGTTNLRVTYKFGDQLLKAEVTLNVFEPLSIFNPESNEVVLPIGSSRNVFYQNGPQKVSYSLEAELIKNTEFNKDLVGVEEVTGSFTSTRLIYNILCRKVGVSKFKILVHNALDHDHYTKYVSEFETTIYCVKPRFIHLYTSEKLKTSCPIDGKNSLMHVRSLKNTLDIEIEVLDANNRKLDNITSLEIDWQFSQANGELNSNIPYELLTETEEIDGVEIPNRVFLKTSITDINMNHKIRAVVQKYNHQVLKKHQVEPEIPNFGIQKVCLSVFH